MSKNKTKQKARQWCTRLDSQHSSRSVSEFEASLVEKRKREKKKLENKRKVQNDNTVVPRGQYVSRISVLLERYEVLLYRLPLLRSAAQTDWDSRAQVLRCAHLPRTVCTVTNHEWHMENYRTPQVLTLQESTVNESLNLARERGEGEGPRTRGSNK